MSLLHLDIQPAAWLIETARPLADAQIDLARRAATGAGMTVETKTQDPCSTGCATRRRAAVSCSRSPCSR